MEWKKLLIEWLISKYGLFTVGLVGLLFVYFDAQIKGIRVLIKDTGDKLHTILVSILSKTGGG